MYLHLQNRIKIKLNLILTISKTVELIPSFKRNLEVLISETVWFVKNF